MSDHKKIFAEGKFGIFAKGTSVASICAPCIDRLLETEQGRRILGISTAFSTAFIVPNINLLTKMLLQFINISTFAFMRFGIAFMQAIPAIITSREKIKNASPGYKSWLLLLTACVVRLAALLTISYSLKHLTISEVAVFSAAKQSFYVIMSTCRSKKVVHSQDATLATIGLTGTILGMNPTHIQELLSKGNDYLQSFSKNTKSPTIEQSSIRGIQQTQFLFNSSNYGRNSAVKNSLINEEMVHILAFTFGIFSPFLYSVNSQLMENLGDIPFSVSSFIQSIFGLLCAGILFDFVEPFTPLEHYYRMFFVLGLVILILLKTASQYASKKYLEREKSVLAESLRMPFTFYLDYEAFENVPNLSVLIASVMNMLPMVLPVVRTGLKKHIARRNQQMEETTNLLNKQNTTVND